VKCQHFLLQELIPPDIFLERGEAAWELLDPSALYSLDDLRETFGPIVVNDWHSGGNFKESGYRIATTPTGAKYSQHKFGRAFDCKPVNVTPAEMSAYILANPTKFEHITTLEDVAKTITWLHFDVRNNPQIGIRVVQP
jgi:hypothetical protein